MKDNNHEYAGKKAGLIAKMGACAALGCSLLNLYGCANQQAGGRDYSPDTPHPTLARVSNSVDNFYETIGDGLYKGITFITDNTPSWVAIPFIWIVGTEAGGR